MVVPADTLCDSHAYVYTYAYSLSHHVSWLSHTVCMQAIAMPCVLGVEALQHGKLQLATANERTADSLQLVFSLECRTDTMFNTVLEVMR